MTNIFLFKIKKSDSFPLLNFEFQPYNTTTNKEIDLTFTTDIYALILVLVLFSLFITVCILINGIIRNEQAIIYPFMIQNRISIE